MTIESVGLIETQTNGGWGHDFTTDPTSIWAVGERLPATGVTTFIPTIITAPYDVAAHAIEVVRAGPPPGYRGARVAGLHIEGPWLSPEKNGAHPADLLRNPDGAVARSWADSGVVVTVTLAPELPGADEVASLLSDAGVVVSAGHSNATAGKAVEALAGPYSSITHLFNQMSPLDHREPGLVGAAMLSDAFCGVIVDGIHVDYRVIRLAWQVLGPDRMILVTDAMAAAGLGAGTFDLGQTTVTVGDDGPRTADGRLAGSVLMLDEALRTLIVATGAPVDEALATVTTTPARMLGLSEADTAGDRVLFDENLTVEATYVDGDLVFGGDR